MIDNKRIKKVELLAPAGNYDCFMAAINAGADAVYLGLERFGARANAGNFTQDELLLALNQAHILGKKIYLTINTLFKDEEINDVFDFLNIPYQNGLDGVIVQDLGLVKYIYDIFPGLEIHASTQMAITDTEGVEFVRKLGICRVVPARELSLEEIKYIYDKTGMELECFIHGAMCYSYSGKCLMSSFIGGRSGNRGRCAQPCRLPYNDDKYLLSMKDMCALSILDKLIAAGISSFKIEGRMKSPDYVYGVTAIYRKYIDLYLSGKDYKVEHEDLKNILSTYTRSGNCNGYYFQKNGRNMLTISSGAYNADGNKGLLTDKEINNKLGIVMTCTIHKDSNIVLRVQIADKDSSFYPYSYEYWSEFIPQIAINNGASIESVCKQLTKTGNTFFKVVDCNIDLEQGLFVSNGQLNQIRRECLENLTKEILDRFKRASREGLNSKIDLLITDSVIKNDSKTIISKDVKVNVFTLNVEQIKEVISSEYVNGLILNYDVFKAIFIDKSIIIQELVERLYNGLDLYIKLPYIIREEQKCFSQEALKAFIINARKSMQEVAKKDISGLYISNLECLNIVTENFKDIRIIGDIHMYSYNKISANLLKSKGIDKLVMPVELNKKEIYRRGQIKEEVIVYGRTPTMISSQCINLTLDACKKSDIGFLRTITDRKDETIPVYCSCMECSNVFYNSVPTFIINEVDFLNRVHPESIRIDFVDENKRQIEEILSKVESLMNHQEDLNINGKYTKGHINRGVD